MNHTKMNHGNQSGGIMLLDHDKRRDMPERERANDNIDPKLTHLNKDLSERKMTPGEAWAFANDLAQACSGRSLRDNQVVMGCDVVHLPSNWEKLTGGADPMRFFEEIALPFLRGRYGIIDEETGECLNEVSAVVHFDEVVKYDSRDGSRVRHGVNVNTMETVPEEFIVCKPNLPHLHRKDVPLMETENGLKLNHKRVHDRADMKTLHVDLQAAADEWCKKNGFEKGLDLYDPDRAAGRDKALTMPEFKAVMEENDRVKAELARAQKELAIARDQLLTAETERDMARDEVKHARAELRDLRQKFNDYRAQYKSIVGEIAKIAEAFSVREFLGSFKNKLMEFASSKICRDALDAGQPFERGRDRKRAERILVKGAKEKVEELKQLGEEMEKYDPFDQIDELRAASRDNAWAKANGRDHGDIPYDDGAR